jgi:hypothetical protein
MGIIESFDYLKYLNHSIIILRVYIIYYNRMILIIQIMLSDIFIKNKLIELFEKIAHNKFIKKYKTT